MNVDVASVTDPKPEPCLFCGMDTSFLCAIKQVCISCHDKLQTKEVQVVPVKLWREKNTELEQLKIRNKLLTYDMEKLDDALDAAKAYFKKIGKKL